MGKRVVIKIGDGSFNQGFPVTLQINEEGKSSNIQKDGRLPTAPAINLRYKKWQETYRALGGRRRVSGPAHQITEISPQKIQECHNYAEALSNSFKDWLNSEDFRPIKDKLIQNLNQNEEIRVVIQTKDKELQQLPWHLWDFFESYPNAEVVISSPEYEFKVVASRPKAKVRILVILGNSEGINVEEDKEKLNKLPKADPFFLVEPTRKQLNDKLYEQQWDILFFAGHSDSQGVNETGRFYLNRNEILTITELKNALRKAIAKGLKLAIFNSCEGIGLARVLGDLQIPQVIFMREPVPDKVAQEFLKYFLSEFAAGKSLHLAVREAREKLQGIEDDFLYATWLPVIFQNSAQAPQNLRELLNQPSVWQQRTGIGIVAIVAIIFIVLFLNPDLNSEITRFLLALLAGISGYLLSGNFGLEAIIPVLSKRIIRGIGTFTTVLSVFFLSLRLPALDADTTRNGPITYRNLTAINNWPTLTLSILNPSLKDELTRKVLSEALQVDSFPLVYSNNPVFKSLEIFKQESGNEQTISEQNKYQTILYQRNVGNRTTTGDVTQEQNSSQIAKKVFTQSKDDYTKDNTFLSFTGEDEYSKFFYAPIMASFQSSLENAKYTSMFTYGQNEYNMIQFPKLSDIKNILTIDDWNLNPNPNLKTIWINKVIENNPDKRGFLAFDYQFTNNLNASLFLDCADVISSAPVKRYTPSPYIKFIDIKNIRLTPINLQSITYTLIEKNPYELTIADKRNDLFRDAEKKTKTDDFNVSLLPGQHVFIPIEFGFDTKPLRRMLQSLTEVSPKNISQLSNQVIHIAKPVLKSVFEKVESKISKGVETNTFFTQSVTLSQDFISNISSSTKLIDLLSQKFAVGSILNIKSLKINGKNISIEPPNDNPPFAMSPYFAEGSCPYLMVYNPQKGYWKELGTVLYGRRQKSLQNEEIHKLGDNISKIKLEEREPEITYIDSLSVQYTDPITKTQAEASLSIPQLTKSDGEYFVLHQGESLDIDLKNLVPKNSTDLRLKVNGYYEVIGQSLLDKNVHKTGSSS